MCLPHYHSASIFQVIDKIEHALNTTITEYYGQADKDKFTEAVDRAQQEVRGRVLIKLAVEKSRKIILAWERCCFSQWHKWLGRANPSTRNKRSMNLWPSGYLSRCCTSWATRDLWEQNMLHTLRTGCTLCIVRPGGHGRREGALPPHLFQLRAPFFLAPYCLQAPAMKEL